MANFIQFAINKVKGVASSLGKTYQNVANSYVRGVAKPLASGNFAQVAQNVGNYFNPTDQRKYVDAFFNKASNIPRYQLPQTFLPTNTNNQVLNFGRGLVRGAIESPLNIPRNLLVGNARLAQEQQNLLQGKGYNFGNALAGVGNLGEAALDLSSFGIGKGIAKGAIEQTAKTGALSAIKKGALQGAGYGAVGGASYGAGNQYNQKFNVGEVAMGAGAGALLGGVLGGAIGGVGSVMKERTYSPKLIKQLREANGRYKAGDVPVKPSGMPKSQWESQLKINEALGRNPYTPAYPSDLQKVIQQKGGLSVKPLTKFEHDANVAKAGLYDVPTKNGTIKVEGTPVDISKGIKTFLSKDENGNWTVHEQSTGMSITQGGYPTTKAAIEDAKNFVDYHGIDKIKAQLKNTQPPPPVQGQAGMYDQSKGGVGYKWYNKDTKTWDIAKDAKPAPIEGLDTFVHKNNRTGRWQVSESKTGEMVTSNSDFKTPEQAIKNATENLQKFKQSGGNVNDLIQKRLATQEAGKQAEVRASLPRVKQLEDTMQVLKNMGMDLSHPKSYDKAYQEWKSLKYPEQVKNVAQQPLSVPKGVEVKVPTNQVSPLVQEPTNLNIKGKLSPTEVKPIMGVGQSGGAGKPPSSTSIADSDLIGKLTQALREAKPLRGTQEELYSKARGAKLAKLMSAREKMAGEKGFFQELGALKGELPKVQYEAIRQQFDQPSVDRLFTMVTQNKYLGDWEKVNAQVGLAKILGQKGGGVPTKGEIGLLDKVFGKDFTEALLSKRGLMEKWGDAGMQLYNISRSMMAGVGDFSGTLMQNLLFAYRHPTTTAKNFVQQVKMFRSETFFNASQEEIASRSYYQAMKDARVALTDVSPIMTAREEAFMASWAEKIPGLGKVIRATGRAYTGFLNRMRADVFGQLYKSAEAMGKDVKDPAFLKSLGSFINNGTGRGSLGKFESSANALSQGLFSARKLVASAQMINPVWYIKADPFVRKEALKTMAAFVGGGMTIVTLADMIPGVEVGKDPTNTDFGKIKVGNTRFNVFGTYQQVAVLLARLFKGYATSSTTGKKMMIGDESNPYSPTRLDLLTRFFESKEHPTLSLILGAMRGTNNIGQPFNMAPEVMNRLIPMILADGYDLYKEHGPIGLLGLIPAILGIPTQTYGSQIPTLKTTPAGNTTIKLNPVGGLAEDVVGKIRGTPPSNIPKPQWAGIVAQKTQEQQATNAKAELKQQLQAGQAPTVNTQDLESAKLIFEYSSKTQDTFGDTFLYKDEKGNVQDVPLTTNIERPKSTGIVELDKINTSTYKADITARMKEIGVLFEKGVIDQGEAMRQIKELNAMKSSVTKPKKLTVKKVPALKAKKLPVYRLKGATSKIKSVKLKTKKYKFRSTL
jgi:hypothetical protein